MPQHPAATRPPLALRPFTAVLGALAPSARAAVLVLAAPAVGGCALLAGRVAGAPAGPTASLAAVLLALLAAGLVAAGAALGAAERRAAQEALELARAQVRERERELAQAAEQLAEQERASFVRQQFTEKQSRARAQELVDDSSSQIVGHLAQVEGQVGSVRSATAAIDEKALTAAAATRGILERAEQADADVAALEESLRSVGSMATVIAQVADQTNLLALNATIEAARAGAAGDGFRVVAAEVKELAATTGRSTAEIAATVSAVQENAHAVLRSLRSVQEHLGGIDEAAAGVREVAAHQCEVVELLQASVAAAVDGAQRMGDLATTMERRRVARFACRQPLTVSLGGRDEQATALDLGLGGARVRVVGAQPPGVGSRVVVRWPHPAGPLVLEAAVARTTSVPDGCELGVVFDAGAAGAAQALRELVAGLERQQALRE
ncbi:methyl-accepting chemotaxis protein [Kineococcus sp. SYSU DK006]|uniref:methyl-accepting chemotaxis protein n=1 Tax=Kineococcus sp. SYSU DK006 TaxID=3383127 RepID=UPI003D7DA5B2